MRAEARVYNNDTNQMIPIKTMRTLFHSLLFSSVCLLAPTHSYARAVEIPTLSEMIKQADLVVIASPTSEKDSAIPMPKNPWPEGTFSSVVTSFKVDEVIKGDKLSEVSVLHYTSKRDRLMLNGPCLVNFHVGARREMQITNPDGSSVKFGVTTPQPWILCLKKGTDGLWVPYTVQTDSSFSFWEMHRSYGQ